MSGEWGPEQAQQFHRYVLGHAVAAGIHDRTALAKATGIDLGLLGRYFRGEVQPGIRNLPKIQAAIPAMNYAHLMIYAGHATPEEFGMSGLPPLPPERRLQPEAEELDRLLGPNSPLSTEEIAELRGIYRRLVSTFKPGSRYRRPHDE